MAVLIPKEITGKEGYKLFCDEIEQAFWRLRSVKKGSFIYKDLEKHYKELRQERSEYIKFQKEALARKQGKQ